MTRIPVRVAAATDCAAPAAVTVTPSKGQRSRPFLLGDARSCLRHWGLGHFPRLPHRSRRGEQPLAHQANVIAEHVKLVAVGWWRFQLVDGLLDGLEALEQLG